MKKIVCLGPQVFSVTGPAIWNWLPEGRCALQIYLLTYLLT